MSRRPGVSVAGLLGRVRADVGPVALTTLVVTLAAFLACATPRLVTATGDDALRHAVVAAGQDAELTVARPPVVDPSAARALQPDLAEATRALAETVEASLAPALADVLAPPVTTVATSAYLLTEPPAGLQVPVLRLVHVDRAGPPEVDWVAGGPAAATLTARDVASLVDREPVPVEVALAEPVATALGVRVGDVVRTRNQNRSVLLDVVVSGVFRPQDPADPVWSHAPGLLEPRTAGSALTRQTQLAGLLSDASLPVAAVVVPAGTVTREVTFAPEVAALGQDDVAQVAAEVAGVRTAADTARSLDGGTTSVTTSLDTVLLDARDRFGAAGAQSAVLLAGVVCAALLTLLVAAVFLVRRRVAVIATYRARGATLTAVALDAGAESVVVAALGVGLGIALAGLVSTGPVPWAWLAPVAVVAAGSAPVLAVRVARASSGGRGVAANRSDRLAAARDRHAGRLVVEAAAVLAAVGATAALRARGVATGAAQAGAPGIPGEAGVPGADPLVALAPSLVAVAGAVVLLRVLPLLLRRAVATAVRRRRAVPVLAAARAHATAGAVLPFVALTLAAGLGVLGATLATTVRTGEVDASWHAVGADVAVTSSPDAGLDDAADELRGRPGVDAVVTGRVEEHVEVFGPWGNRLMRVVVVPSAAVADLLAGTPLPDAPELAGLDASPDARPGVLLAAGTRRDGDDALELAWGGTRVDVATVGTAPAVLTALGTPREALGPDDDTVVVDRAALERALGTTVAPNRLWVVGEGAQAAVEGSARIDPATVTTRAAWLADHRSEPLVVGVQRLATAAVVVLVALAVLVVVLAAATSAPQRGVTLANLRTLGLDGRAARAVTAGELLPGGLLASVGGVGLGVLLAALVTGPLALRLVTGQPTDPQVAFTPWVAAAPVVVLATVAVLVLVESSVRRRERLGQVLRVGGPGAQ